MEDFTERLARIQQCINGDGNRNLQNILKTCTEMLHDRGFENISKRSLDGEGNTLGLVMVGERDGGEHIRVHICMEDRVGVKFARAVLEVDDSPAIVISIDGPTPFTRRECGTVQFFNAIGLCKNVTRHCLVPKHDRIEATELPDGIQADRLPRLLDSDRIVQYYAWPSGSVVKIKRIFGGYEPITYFRLVVAACGV
jgi:DNA-directed RNA polymerase subunit H (RpoH/RPB5)